MSDQEKTVKVVVDRLESGSAVLQLLNANVTVSFPALLLPEAVNEGSVVEINLTNRPDLEEQRREQIEKLQHKLIEKPGDQDTA